MQRERRQRYAANRTIGLRMILTMGELALAADDRSSDPCGGDRVIQVDILDSDREDLADARRRAEHYLDDLAELSIRPRSRRDTARLPRFDRCPDVLHLIDGERVRDGLLPV